mgnify:CR=1 FL=1
MSFLRKSGEARKVLTESCRECDSLPWPDESDEGSPDSNLFAIARNDLCHEAAMAGSNLKVHLPCFDNSNHRTAITEVPNADKRLSARLRIDIVTPCPITSRGSLSQVPYRSSQTHSSVRMPGETRSLNVAERGELVRRAWRGAHPGPDDHRRDPAAGARRPHGAVCGATRWLLAA